MGEGFAFFQWHRLAYGDIPLRHQGVRGCYFAWRKWNAGYKKGEFFGLCQ